MYGVIVRYPSGIGLALAMILPPSLCPLAGGLEFELVDQLADGGRRLLEGGALLRGELDLDDLLDALPTELHGNAHVEPLHPVRAIQVGGARQDLLLVLEDGL